MLCVVQAGTMPVLFAITILALIAHTSAYCPVIHDPCNEANHRKLDSAIDLTRNQHHLDSSAPYYGDFALIDGWYRAVTAGGGDMPTETPGFGHCQALYPIWFNESFPTETDGAVERKACVQTFSGDCADKLDICIKKCNINNDVYNVYWLTSPSNANARYCFGTKIKCKDKAGFEPCTDEILEPVVNSSLVKTVIPNTDNRGCEYTNHFYCYIQHTNTSLFFDVTWSADGKVVKTFTDVAYTKEAFELTPEDLRNSHVTKYGITLRCTVAPKLQAMGLVGVGNWSEMYIGFEASTTHVSLKEGGAAEYFTVKTTVPLECREQCTNEKKKSIQCRLIFSIQVPEDSSNGGCFTATEDVVFETAIPSDNIGKTCQIDMYHDPFVNPFELNIPIKAKLDDLYDNDKEFALQLISEAPSTEFQTLWSDVSLPRVQVSAVDKDSQLSGKECYFRNDPHVKSFNGRSYEMQLEGVFVLYRQITGIPIEVQGFFKRKGIYSTSCGIAIRSYGELYVVNHCGDTFHTKFYECDHLNAGGATVKNLGVYQNETHYTITLPTGGTVQFYQDVRFADPEHYEIKISPGLSDYKNTEGLCGYLQEDCTNDLIAKDTGKKFGNCECDIWCSFDPKDFYNSWRINENLEDSLFTGNINDNRKFKDTVFCGCEGQQANGNFTAVCTADGASSKKCVKPGNDVTDKFKRYCGISKKKRALVIVDDLDDTPTYVPNNYDVNYVPPPAEWKNGWTESTALQYCEDYYNRSSVHMCKDVAGVSLNASVSICVVDIHISGGTEFSQVGVNAIISQCISEIRKNVTLFTTNTTSSSGQVISIADQLLSNLCPSDCNDHGQCVNGVCQCSDDYIGSACLYNKHHVPTLKPIPFDGVCDKQNRPCQMSIIYGDLFLENENLTCQVQVLNMNGTSRHHSYSENATYEHYQKVFCPLLDSQLPYILNISVSNDRTSYSNHTQLLVYDSTCWSCSLAAGCTKKEMTCVIHGSCYAEGMRNPSNSREFCSPANNQYGWTEETTSSANTQTSDTSNTAIYLGIGFGAFVILLVVGALLAWRYIKSRGKDALLDATKSSAEDSGVKPSESEPRSESQQYMRRSLASLNKDVQLEGVEADEALGPVDTDAWGGNVPLSHTLQSGYFRQSHVPTQPSKNGQLQAVSPVTNNQMGTTYNFKEMRPKTSQKPNNLIEPLRKPTQPRLSQFNQDAVYDLDSTP